MNAGAQKLVIQRVKKMPGVGPPAGSPEKTRTWSMAISTITAPRTRSTEARRELPGAEWAAGMVGRSRLALIENNAVGRTRDRQLPPGAAGGANASPAALPAVSAPRGGG